MAQARKRSRYCDCKSGRVSSRLSSSAAASRVLAAAFRSFFASSTRSSMSVRGSLWRRREMRAQIKRALHQLWRKRCTGELDWRPGKEARLNGMRQMMESHRNNTYRRSQPSSSSLTPAESQEFVPAPLSCQRDHELWILRRREEAEQRVPSCVRRCRRRWAPGR